MAEGNKLSVQGLEYTNPTQPKLREIRNYGIPQSKQVWSRRDEYLHWNWNTDSKLGDVWYKNPDEEQLDWYEQELIRIEFGEWIFINGEATYINKWFYFFLQWHTLQEGIHPSFRDTALEFFRFYELIDEDAFTLGVCGIKGRRLGMSSQAASVQLQICLLEENNQHGIVSKTGKDAQEMFYMVRFSLENLPSFLMPEMRTIGEKELFFGTPAQRISKNNKTPNTKKGLNNRASWLATEENSYDGRRLRTIILDEAAKLEDKNIVMLFSKISETLVTGASVVGKVLMFSTVNAMDKGGRNFKSIWDDSNQNGKLDSIGQTTSRLKRFFIEGYRGVNGYTDKFGFSVIEKPTPEQTEWLKILKDPTTGKLACPDPNIGAKEYRQSRRDALSNDPEKLAEEKRKFPFTWEEVFKTANNQCYFNTEDINNQLEVIYEKLSELGRNPEKDELGRRGWFKKLENGRVTFVDDKDGLWYIHELLNNEDSNKYEINSSGKKIPTNTAYGAAGLDTFANANKIGENGSDACCIIRKRYSSAGIDSSGMPVAMFLGRMRTKREYHAQIFNGIQYYGVKMVGELSPTDFVDYANEEKLDEYLFTFDVKSNGEKVKGIYPQNKEQREEHLTEMIESSYSDHKKIWFKRLLRDRQHFDIDNRTLWDACIADGLALIGLKFAVKQVAKSLTGVQFLRQGRILS